MEYRVVELGEFYLMGKVGRIPLIFHGPNHHTANVWKQLRQEDLLVLMEHSVIDPKGILIVYEQGVDGSIYKFKEGDEILYGVGVAMEKPMPDRFKGRFDVLPFEASTWLIFTSVGNKKDSKHIDNGNISEWLPTSEWKETGAHIIEWTESYDFTKPDRICETWIPVRKRVT